MGRWQERFASPNTLGWLNCAIEFGGFSAAATMPPKRPASSPNSIKCFWRFALPNPNQANIRRLADRLLLRHHSAVGLIDRLEARGYVRRTRSGPDQRKVCVTLLPRGQRALERVVRERLHELRESGQAFISTIARILKHADLPRSRRNVQPATKRSDHPKPHRPCGCEGLSPN